MLMTVTAKIIQKESKALARALHRFELGRLPRERFRPEPMRLVARGGYSIEFRGGTSKDHCFSICLSFIFVFYRFFTVIKNKKKIRRQTVASST